MRQPSTRRKLLPIAVNCPVVIARPVGIVIADTGAYDRTIIAWPVIGIRVAIIVGRFRRIICAPIITGVIRGHVWSLCTSAQESCNDACAQDRQQQCSTTRGFHWCFHLILPFLQLNFPFSFAKPRTRLRVACWPPSCTTVSPANVHSMIRSPRLNRPPLLR